ncbi:tail fiber domain-containing protein [Pseudoalteromonas sp. C2R02]|uniref:tail fiber domain-containing protein n=1 Tax=Pseudoalteromonas sp. C2R02 TaxID=2841565 RepID=UPI001C07FD52|nr:tail fiber domain-containing protein [Pseudoalteromonas sp. C2R02]MBU2971727.1 tail fiber domain-containing protein [Pseudoalteromonas sp. C2R02]
MKALNKIAQMSAVSLAILASFNNIADQVIQDDHIVIGSSCIGVDCANGESFGFDTIRLKENNLRIRFVDTSSSSSFPTADWQLTANESGNGGINKFSIDDIDSGTTPFTIIQTAPNNSLYVRENGFIGFNTSTPVVNLHLKYGNSPALRLEQDGSSGFASQTWDVAGNETNFFIRDVTNSSKIPLKITPGASNNALYIAADGDVGLETASPDGQFDVAHYSNANNHAFLIDSISNVGINIDNGRAVNGLFDVQSAGNSKFLVQSDGDVGINTSTPDSKLHINKELNKTSLLINTDGTANSTDFIVSSTGLVGIGTDAPSSLLDIQDDAPSVVITDTSSGTADFSTLLTLSNNGGTNMSFLNRDTNVNWSAGSSISGNSFLIRRSDFVDADGNTDNDYNLKIHGDGTLSIKDINEVEILKANSTTLTSNGTFVSSSSRTVKENITAVNPQKILNTLSKLTLAKWNYINDEDKVKHIGPIAEEFYSLFNLGKDEKHIASLDTAGVALAAIQALNNSLTEKDSEIEELTVKLSNIEKKLNKLLANQ